MPSREHSDRPAYIEQGDRVSPAFWIAAAALIVAAMLQVPLGEPALVAAATVLVICGGLPHGAYDLELLRRAITLDRHGLIFVVGGYVALAVGTAILWTVFPLGALMLFLAISAMHFSEDWPMLDEPFLRLGAGAAVIAAPTIGHPADVTTLFVAMSDERATLIAQLITAAAPVILLVAAVGVAAAWRDGSRSWAVAMALCLVLLLILPPVAGFALFFVFLHSPRHLSKTRASLPRMSQKRWLMIGISLSGAAILGWLALHQLAPLRIEGNMTVQAFQLLAAVAVPHLILSRWLERRLGREERRRLQPARVGNLSA